MYVDQKYSVIVVGGVGVEVGTMMTVEILACVTTSTTVEIVSTACSNLWERGPHADVMTGEDTDSLDLMDVASAGVPEGPSLFWKDLVIFVPFLL